LSPEIVAVIGTGIALAATILPRFTRCGAMWAVCSAIGAICASGWRGWKGCSRALPVVRTPIRRN